MTNRITTPPEARTVIVGVETHKHVHVAVAIDSWGIRLGDHAFVVDSGGYEALVTWAETHGRIEAFGNRRHRELRRWPGTGRPPSRASCRGSESGRPPYTPRRRQVRHHRRRGGGAVPARGAVDGHPQDRGRRRRDDPPAQDHTGYRHESAHHGDEHAEADHRAGPARPARSPSTTSPITACSRAAPDSDRAPSTRPSRPPSTPSGRSPVGGWLSPRKSRCTTSTSRVSPPRHHRPSARASVWAPTPRLSC